MYREGEAVWSSQYSVHNAITAVSNWTQTCHSCILHLCTSNSIEFDHAAVAGYITWLLQRHQAGVHTVHWVQAGAGPALPHRAEGQQESDDDILQCTSIHQYGVKFKQKFKSELIKLWPGVGREFKACIQSWEHLRHPRGPQCSAAVLQGAGQADHGTHRTLCMWPSVVSVITIITPPWPGHKAQLRDTRHVTSQHQPPAPGLTPGVQSKC